VEQADDVVDRPVTPNVAGVAGTGVAVVDPFAGEAG
jgi:hypothetical protein